MIVTDITDMDKKRRKVYLDGEYAFALYNSEIYRYNLEVVEEIVILLPFLSTEYPLIPKSKSDKTPLLSDSVVSNL